MRRLLSVPLLALAACGSEPDPDLEEWHYTAVTHADGRFVAVGGAGDNHGESGAPGARIATSTDGDTWNVVFPDHGVRSGVTHGAGSWVAVGRLGDHNYASVLISSDGETWRPATGAPLTDLHGVAFGNGVFVATEWWGAQVYVSTDAETWTEVTIGQPWTNPEVAFVEGRFIVHGAGALVAESTDGVAWTLSELPLSHVNQVVARGGAVYGIGLIDYWNGERPELVRSVVVEGPGTWTVREREGLPLISIAFAGNAVVASTYDGLVRGPDIEGGPQALAAVSPGATSALAADGLTVVAGGKTGIRVSHDAGATWAVAVGPDPE